MELNECRVKYEKLAVNSKAEKVLLCCFSPDSSLAMVMVFAAVCHRQAYNEAIVICHICS
jgi:hypothetical protein